MCEECVGNATLVKGDGRTATEKCWELQRPTEDAEMTAPEVAKNDVRSCNICLSRSSNDELGDRSTDTDARKVNVTRPFVSTQTNRPWIYTCTACQRHH